MVNKNNDDSYLRMVEKNETSPSAYFGCGFGYLDIFNLSYRWFGAVWQWQGEVLYILGYWFADSKEELLKLIKDSGWIATTEVKEKQKIGEIHQRIRMEQNRQDWIRRSRLPLLSVFRSPWRELELGWYVLRSRSQFPLIVSCLQKTWYAVWIEHNRVCENEKEVKDFIQSVNEKHGIKLEGVNDSGIKKK